MSAQVDAAFVVSAQLAQRPPGERAKFLRELMVHSAAGLVVIEGKEQAAESAYRMADAIVERGRP